MSVLPIGVPGVLPLASAQAIAPASSGGQTFGSLVGRFIEDTNSQQLQADQAVQNLATG